MSASENCIDPNSFLTSQMHQWPPHPSGKQRQTQATKDQASGGQGDQQFVFGQVRPAMGMGSTKHDLVDGKSLRPGKDVLNFNRPTLFGNQKLAIQK